MPRPRWGQLQEFCRKQGYIETRTDHFHYLKVLPNRSTSGTMVSMGVEGENVPPVMWQRIWKDQLRLPSEDEFWKGLRGEPVQYAVTTGEIPTEPLPNYLQRFLEDTLHFTEAEIENLTRDQSQDLLNEYYSRELQDD